MVALQVPLQLAQQPARNRAQRAVGPLRLPVVLGMVAEALVTVDRLELAGVAAAHRQPLGLDNLPDFLDDLLQQFRIGWVCHILLLDRRVYDARVERTLVVVVVIDTDALGQNQFHAALADAMTEVHQLGRGARLASRERVHTTEVLVVGVLRPLLHNRLVREVADMLQDQQAAHQADVLGRSAHALTIQRRERLVKTPPVDLVGKKVQWVTLVEHVGQGIEQ